MISIVMTYYNRREQLLRTLKTINYSSVKNKEVIIIDDGSSESEKLNNVMLNSFNFHIKLKIITVAEKKWINPCIPYNMGFAMAEGNTIIIQNPECLHCGDVLLHVKQNISDGKYLVYSCLNVYYHHYISLCKKYNFNRQATIKRLYNDYKNARTNNDVFWYNHPSFYNRPLHFCTAITNKDLKENKGFDERFANGLWYDDDEFIWRISKKMNVVNHDTSSPFVIHQWHPASHNEDARLKKVNYDLFENIKKGV